MRFLYVRRIARSAPSSPTHPEKASERKPLLAAILSVATLTTLARADDLLLTAPGDTTPEMVSDVVAAFGQIIPDLMWETVEIIEAGDRFIAQGHATGSPVAPFFGIDPPSGNSFDIVSIDIHRVANGVIVGSYYVEEWATAIRKLTAK